MERSECLGIIEAILFVAGEPIATEDLQYTLEVSSDELDELLTTYGDTLDYERRGIRLLRFGEHVQLATRTDYAPYVERLLQPVQKRTLTQAAMETLAVVAYKQPVTRAEIEALRGVKCDYSIQSLVQKSLIVEVGRKEALGRPLLYGTTDAFLRHFGIESLEDLPTINFDMPLVDDTFEEDEENREVLGPFNSMNEYADKEVQEVADVKEKEEPTDEEMPEIEKENTNSYSEASEQELIF